MVTELAPPPLKIQSRPEFADILRVDETFATGVADADDVEDRVNGAFDKLLLQSGLEIAPGMFLTLSLFAAITLGGVAFVWKENLLTTALGFLIGGLIPLTWAVIARSRRQQKMMTQLPEMVDELARASRTGRSIDQCFSMVAEDTPSPLGDELRLCAGKLELGVGLKAALRDLPERTGLVSMNILEMALAVHVTTGGDLISVLERLSKTIRERMLYLGRLRAATAASRATAILMVVLPPAILTFFAFRDPEYFSKLFGAAWGFRVTVAAVVLDLIGVAWVLRILKSSQQT